jgi:hypothetical protein
LGRNLANNFLFGCHTCDLTFELFLPPGRLHGIEIIFILELLEVSELTGQREPVNPGLVDAFASMAASMPATGRKCDRALLNLLSGNDGNSHA